MKKFLFGCGVVIILGAVLHGGGGKNPVIEEAPDGSGRILVLPDDLKKYLASEFPNYRIPNDSEYNPQMLQYFNSRLIGVHPSIAWGDFNGDKKRDYALLLITSETKWGPLCELIILNGSRGGYDTSRLGEVYNFKDDYVCFTDNKLSKGRFKKGAWYINWDKKTNTYAVLKS